MCPVFFVRIFVMGGVRGTGRVERRILESRGADLDAGVDKVTLEPARSAAGLCPQMRSAALHLAEARCGIDLKKATKKAFKTKADHLCKTLFNVYVITRNTK